MSTRTRAPRPTTSVLAALLFAGVLVLTSACATENGDRGAPSTESSTTSSTSGGDPAGQQPDPGQAVKLSFRKTGGLRGIDESTTYAVDAAPPAGSSKAEVRAILAAASDPGLRDVELEPVPKNACCDLQEYSVTVSYADGSSESFRTVDGLQQPPVFEDLLSMLG